MTVSIIQFLKTPPDAFNSHTERGLSVPLA